MTTFTSPLPARQTPTGEAELERDHYGRPMVIPPEGGKAVPYTRCTQFVSALEDRVALEKWTQRQTAIGLALRNDLIMGVHAHRDNKTELQKICDEAKEAAGASAAATTGTALHALTEIVDRGGKLPTGLPSTAVADLEAYRIATTDLDPILIEKFCVLDTYRIGGTPDRVVELNGTRYIADLKTGDINYGALKIAMQLAVYSRSLTYTPANAHRAEHGADTSRGIIIHLPAGTGTCSLHWVDLDTGWDAVHVAKEVRERRKIKFKDIVETLGEPVVAPPPPLATATIAGLIANAPNEGALRDLWAANSSAWDATLTDLAKRRLGEFRTGNPAT